MTNRDIVWDTALTLLIKKGQKRTCEYLDHPKSVICHYDIINNSRLSKSNKRTIKRTLETMCDLGWLNREEKWRKQYETDHFVNVVPICYSLDDSRRRQRCLGEYTGFE